MDVQRLMSRDARCARWGWLPEHPGLACTMHPPHLVGWCEAAWRRRAWMGARGRGGRRPPSLPVQMHVSRLHQRTATVSLPCGALASDNHSQAALIAVALPADGRRREATAAHSPSSGARLCRYRSGGFMRFDIGSRVPPPTARGGKSSRTQLNPAPPDPCASEQPRGCGRGGAGGCPHCRQWLGARHQA